ncbi:hypothetical protein BZA05DRAFT_275867 [Tricharina praecox]|uniref:uncharacterized protein n=1 Tax=Tricharina praecox TaxID=43433 RepID=UPI00221ED05B|nr:uncharacterized protein BZA05DRAFT_275867 [Tricharina praecox]KAI5853974.1 hypothetical protein BZA05DRAFT_275867 [Tricharina praecox]
MHIPPLPISSLPQFLHFHSIALNGISPVHLGGAPIDLGVALTFTSAHDPTKPLLRVSPTLVLSHATIEAASKSDRHLHDALSAAGALAHNPRIAAMIFLLLRMSTAAGLVAGERDAWCEYTQYLPRTIPLPTTWTATELALLPGTSLSAAIAAKSRTLAAEFSTFRAATAELAWAQKAWWDDDGLTLENWVYADSVYRSRSLELPGHGAALVPILDFANHAEAGRASAYFAVEGEDVVLRLRPGMECTSGDEVCIDYSDSAKSAAEFVFAYGFIPEGMGGAGGMLLPLQCSEDDPLARAKEMVWAPASPRGVKISETTGEDKVQWESEWAYLAVTNEEDGLEFQLLQMNDGGRKLQVLLDGEELDLVARPRRVQELLKGKEMCEIFELRVVATVKAAVEDALSRLLGGRHALEEEEGVECRPQMWSVGTRLRELEETLLLKAAETLAEEESALLEHPKVQEYLSQQQQSQSPEPHPQRDLQSADAMDADGEIDLS